MKKSLTKDYLIFLLLYGIFLITAAFLIKALYPIHLPVQRLLFFDLIELSINFNPWILYFFGSINILLIWIISKNFFPKYLSLIPVLVYCISPWSIYLIVAGSFYIFLTTIVLTAFLGILLIKSGRSKIGNPLFILGTLLSLYSHLILIIISPLLLIGIVITKFINFKKILFPLFIILVFCIPLFISAIKNEIGIKNIFKNQVTLLADPGHINVVNIFQGESSKAKLFFLSKLSENKYEYFVKYLAHKLLKNISLSTYFTPSEKLLNFSFSPPIYFGFLLPFLFGLYMILKSAVLRNYFFVSLILIIPSVLSTHSVDLTRLVLFEPVIILLISVGIIKMITSYKKRFIKTVLALSLFLVLLQFFVTISDINSREYSRHHRYLEDSFQINE